MRVCAYLLVALLPCVAVAQESAPPGLPHIMTVHGEAVARVAPDQLTLPVTVAEENASLQVAKERHDDKLRKLLKLAESAGIPKDKIQTSFTAVNPVYDYEKDSSHPRLRGYRIETSLNFMLTDFARLGDFMNGIIKAGIDTIGSISYSLQDEGKVKDDTLNLAMQHAYDKAARLAATAKVTLGQPVTIDEGDAQVSRPMPPRPMGRMMMAMSSNSAVPPPELPASVIEIRQSVTVSYALK